MHRYHTAANPLSSIKSRDIRVTPISLIRIPCRWNLPLFLGPGHRKGHMLLYIHDDEGILEYIRRRDSPNVITLIKSECLSKPLWAEPPSLVLINQRVPQSYIQSGTISSWLSLAIINCHIFSHDRSLCYNDWFYFLRKCYHNSKILCILKMNYVFAFHHVILLAWSRYLLQMLHIVTYFLLAFFRKKCLR